MRLLVLGGTLFLGRHLVDAGLARGHEVTVFTRGRRPNPWPDRVTQRSGDRDPQVGAGLAALDEGTWDAVIDTSGYLPRCVAAGAQKLRERAGFYLFVSSISVYADAIRPGLDENTPRATLADPHTEDIPTHYGALKAACEDVVSAAFTGRAAIVRPGLIVGPHDPTDRFAYWVARFRQPALLGDRAERAVVPGPASRPVQVIDARDLAQWSVDLVEQRLTGEFNACSPEGQWTMGDLVQALEASGTPAPAWVGDATLIAHEVVPWTGLPLWLPADDPEHAGIMSYSGERARVAGLSLRPLRDTVDATADWLATRAARGAFAHVMSAEVERAVLDDIDLTTSTLQPALP